MKKLNINQTGSAIIILLVILVLAVIGFGGYYVWHTQHTKATVVTPAKSTTATTITKPTTTTPASNQKYLAIKEFGVELPLTSAITDAEYRTDDMDPSNVFFAVKSMDSTNCNLDQGGAGFIVRFKQGDNDGEAKVPFIQEYPDAVQVGMYYYGYGVNPAVENCGGDAATQQKIETIRADIKTQLKLLKPLS